MDKKMITLRLDETLDKMVEKAHEMNIAGVAVANVLNRGEELNWVGAMKVAGKPFSKQGGWNFVGVAWSKAAEAMAAERNSGIIPDYKPMVGETGYDGGAYEEYNGYKLAFAFSGATGEQDLQVAMFGLEEFKKCLD